ncbi:MAG: hypothetical protein ABR582_14480 [Gemmatimonadaceae bacterium]
MKPFQEKKRPNPREVYVVAVLLGLLAAAPSLTRAQGVLNPINSGAPESCETLRQKFPRPTALKKYPVLPKYQLRLLRDSSVRVLKRMLTHTEANAAGEKTGRPCWAEARELYFTTYLPTIPDWIVYIDSSGIVYQDLQYGTRRTRRSTTNRSIAGKRFINVLVLSDMDLSLSRAPSPTKKPLESSHLLIRGRGLLVDAPLDAKKAASPDSGSDGTDESQLCFRRRVVSFQRDPILKVLIAALGKTLSVTSSDEPALVDSSQIISLLKVSEDPTAVLYAALGRLGLIENTRIEFSLEPVKGKQFGPLPVNKTDSAGLNTTDSARLTSVYMVLGNDREHTFEAGLVAGMTLGRPIQTFTDNKVSNEGSRVSGNVYLAATWNLFWFSEPISTWLLHAREPWRRSSFGPTVGTGILHGVWDEFVSGFTFGHVLGDAGITVAADWLAEPEIRNGHVINPRKARWLGGFYLTF